MPRREENRSLSTRLLHWIAKGLVIAALGTGIGVLFGNFGLPARALGMLGALAISGTAVAVDGIASHLERQRCQEVGRAIEEENRKVDAFVAEMTTPHLAVSSQLEEPRFVRMLEERQQSPGWAKGR